VVGCGFAGSAEWMEFGRGLSEVCCEVHDEAGDVRSESVLIGLTSVLDNSYAATSALLSSRSSPDLW
jgi:hypothetical protein